MKIISISKIRLIAVNTHGPIARCVHKCCAVYHLSWSIFHLRPIFRLFLAYAFNICVTCKYFAVANLYLTNYIHFIFAGHRLSTEVLMVISIFYGQFRTIFSLCIFSLSFHFFSAFFLSAVINIKCKVFYGVIC